MLIFFIGLGLIFVLSISFCLHCFLEHFETRKLSNINFLSTVELENFVEKYVKKRKNNDFGSEKCLKLCKKYKSNKNKKYVSYKNICLEKIDYKTNLFGDDVKNNILFPEKIGFNNKDFLKQEIEEINSLVFQKKYRAFKNKILILEIAKTYVFLSLTSSFDMVNHFKLLSKKYIFLKKEIKILPHLIKYFFLKEMLKCFDELYSEREKILKAQSLIKISPKEFHDNFFVYGLAKFNKNARSLILKFNIDVNFATSIVCSEFLFKIKFLRSGILWLQFFSKK